MSIKDYLVMKLAISDEQFGQLAETACKSKDR